MEEQGVVSLWVGVAASAEALEDYVACDSYEAGELVDPAFAKDFHLEPWDEDFREARYIPNATRDLTALLGPLSYADIILPRFDQVHRGPLPEPANAVVLLYNYRHSGSIVQGGSGGVRLSYVGLVSYIGRAPR